MVPTTVADLNFIPEFVHVCSLLASSVEIHHIVLAALACCFNSAICLLQET